MLYGIGYVLLYLALALLSIVGGNEIRVYFTHLKLLEGLKNRLYLPNKEAWTLSYQKTGWGKRKKRKTVLSVHLDSAKLEGYELILLPKSTFFKGRDDLLLLDSGFETENTTYTFSKKLCVATNNLELTQQLLTPKVRKGIIGISAKYSLSIYNSTLKYQQVYTKEDQDDKIGYIGKLADGGFSTKYLYEEIIEL